MTKLLTYLLAGLLLIGGGQLHAQKKEKKGKKGKGTTTTVDPKTKERVDYLFIEANTLYVQDKKAEAVGLLKELLTLSPQNHAALYMIGKINNELKNYNEAVRYCKQALDLDAYNYWYYTELVAAWQGARDMAKALEVQAALAKHFPNDKNALYDLAQLYILNKDFKNAVATYDQLEKITGPNDEISFRKHQLYVYTNQTDKALAEIDKLIAANPKEPRYLQSKYDLLMLLQKNNEAMALLEQILQSNPNDGFALLSLADYYKAQGNMPKSDEYLQRAFDNPEVDLEAKVNILSGMYPHAENNPDVLKRMDRMSKSLLALHPKSAIVWGIRGDVMQAAEKPDSAMSNYRKSLQIDPSNERVWQELLLVSSDAGNWKSMQKDAEKALEYFPNKSLFLYFFGTASVQNGDTEEAIYAFEKIKKAESANKDLLVQAYLGLAEAYHKEDQFAKSDENFEAAKAASPNNPLVLNNYAYYLSLRGERLEDASKMVQEALKQEPNNGAYQDTYGWILYLQGNYSGAKEWIGKAVGDGGAEVLEHYGDACAKLGESDKAREYWQKAIDKGAKFDLNTKLTRGPK
ncbi:MAG: tetratricopeptide repeat protein [Bacteroidia bacterium]